MPSRNSYEQAAAKRSAVEREHPLSATLLGYRRERLATAPKPRQAFEEWLDTSVALISAVQVVRQSSKRKSEYAQHFETATTYREADPDVAAVRSLDIGDLLDGAEPGVATFRVEKRHLRGGGRSRAFVGTAVVVGTTLFLFILNSAAEDNLEGLSEDQAGNAFTATVQAAVRRLSYRQWTGDITARLWVHFPDKSRLARDDRHAINLVDTLAWAGVILRIAADTYPNLDERQAKMVLQIMLSVSAQELESIVKRLFGTRFGILRAGQWLGQEAPPITHRLATETRTDGTQTWVEQDAHRLEPREDAVRMMRGLVDTALRSAGDRVKKGPVGINLDPKAIPNWKHVAWIAGNKLGVESRDWTHLRRGGLQIHQLSQGGAANLRKYLAPRWIEGWRSGRTPIDLAIPKVIASNFPVELTEHQEWIERPDGTVAVRTLQEMPLPLLECAEQNCRREGHLDQHGNHLTHGFGIPEWKWDRLQELLERTSRRTGEHSPDGHGHDVRRHPFASTFQWDTGDRQYKLRAVNRDSHGAGYTLYSRQGPPNPNRGWTFGADEACRASIVGSTFNRALGEDLERLLGDIDRDLVALNVAEPDRKGADRPVEQPIEALEQAREAAAVATQTVKTARRALLLAKTELDRLDESDVAGIEEAHEQVKEATKMLQEAKANHSEASSLVQHCEEQLTATDRAEEQTEGEGSAIVELSEHLIVAKALQKANGATDRALNDAVLQMLDPDRSHIEAPHDDHRIVIVRPTWRFIDAQSGEALIYQRTVHVERLPANPKTKTKIVDVNRRDRRTIPKMLLLDGLSRSEIGERFGIGFDPGDSKSYGFQIIRRWLDAHGVNRQLHQALLDAPPLVRRALYLARTADHGALDELLAAELVDRDWVDLLVTRYTADTIVTRGSWAPTWAPSDHGHDRSVIQALVARGGRANIGDLAADTCLTLEQVARTAHMVPHSQRHLVSPRFGQPPAVIKGEWRSRTIAPLGKRHLWLLDCPHDDCDGHVTHPLWTPETDPDRTAEHQHAALCPACRRTPWGPQRYPADYLRYWTGPIGRTGGRGTRKATILIAAPTTSTAHAA